MDYNILTNHKKMTQNRIMYMYVSGEHRVPKSEVTKQYKNNNNKHKIQLWLV